MNEIRKLAPEVVQKIAAGERPVHAVKEMLENSIDAKASFVQISLKDGGFSMIQIQDNGCGIKRQSLELVCERFATSKISSVDDLKHTKSFGFRGEALAAISYVSKVTITTRTYDTPHAYKAIYHKGRYDNSCKEPKVCAGNIGTIVVVEDLFGNIPLRKKALGNPNEEYLRVIDVVSKYAIAFPHISFSCRKIGSNNAELNTTSTGNSLQIIKQLYPSSLYANLKQFESTCFNGFVSAPSCYQKKSNVVVFINGRLVTNTPIKKAIEAVFSKFSMKGNHVWAFLMLQVLPERLDVNVHPTKSEVRFLDEDEVIEQLSSVLSSVLSAAVEQKDFSIPRIPATSAARKSVSNSNSSSKPAVEYKTPVYKLNRVDSKSQTLEELLTRSAQNKKSGSGQYRPVVEVRLTSIIELRQEIDKSIHSEWGLLFKEMKFIGAATRHSGVFQSGTGLYLFELEALSEELFYQLILKHFHNLDGFELSPPIPVSGLVENDVSIDILLQRRMMLEEYFSIIVTDECEIKGLPILIGSYSPALQRLKTFLQELTNEVRTGRNNLHKSLWVDEKTCFNGISKALARLYRIEGFNSLTEETKSIFLDKLKGMKLVSEVIAGGAVKEIADLSRLYRIFERC